ncbi:MAG: HD domain-containing protein [Deltaproteobacteria bacterium]|nr:HD domain-containing protein [Deltaproteobacteria bacterium]MBI3293364.1 HD domain-containing protein [Deltaproteobacteria bacterium]
MADDLNLLAIPLESVVVDTPTQFPLYVKIGSAWVLFRPEGDVITKERMNSLRAKEVSLIYVPEESWNSYVAGLEHTVGSPTSDDNDANTLTQIRSLLLAYSQEVERHKQFEKNHFQKFVKLADRLATAIYKNSEMGKRMLRRYGDPSMYFVNHSLNVAAYSAELAKRLGVPLSAAKKLTCGALVHNTGYLFLPKSVLYKPSALTKEEWNLIYSHPEKGAELLGRMDAPTEVVIVALQHHERVDGKGYPAKKGSKDIHLFARICSIADVFDALTNNAPYQAAHTSKEAIVKMIGMKGKFDGDILHTMAEVG